MEGPPRVTQAALAKACNVAPPSVNDWLSGKSKTMESSKLLAAARFLNVNADWLATGKGSRELNVKLPLEGVGQALQIHNLDPATLSRALFWLDFEEGVKGLYQPLRRASRLMDLYQAVESGGGDLPREQADELIEAARRQGVVKDGRSTKAAGGN
jgi:transcriptional regulator with XRE-family HTH domain